MAPRKGSTNNAAGRPKGIPNKATQDARRAIGEFVDGNAHRLTEWLDAVAVEDPAKAFNLFQSVIEYHVPKLQRQEITGKEGGAVQVDINGDVTHKVLALLPEEELQKLVGGDE